jgi:hypothetical protein
MTRMPYNCISFAAYSFNNSYCDGGWGASDRNCHDVHLAPKAYSFIIAIGRFAGSEADTER